jgi:hypothetical protein
MPILRTRLVPCVTVCVLLLAGRLGAAPLNERENSLPRFTEEREAAALFFVKKHVPEVLPLLTQLKKANVRQYQQEIREVFQVTEMLAELQDEPRRHELELKIWKAETRASVLVAKLSTPNEEERKKVEAGLQDLAKELVELDIQVLEHKADVLDKELGTIKDELARARDQMEKQTETRYKGLLEQAKKRKK